MSDNSPADVNRIACEAMGIPVGTKLVSCCVHGELARPEDVHELNNWETDESSGQLRCVPDHPYCFHWASPDLTPEEIGPDYCLACGAFIGDGGMIEKARDGCCVECDDSDEPAESAEASDAHR